MRPAPGGWWPVVEILVGSLRPSTPLAASKMLDAGPDCDCAFLLARNADDSETPSPYFNDRPLDNALRRDECFPSPLQQLHGEDDRGKDSP
jgi:hypothetical protein